MRNQIMVTLVHSTQNRSQPRSVFTAIEKKRLRAALVAIALLVGGTAALASGQLPSGNLSALFTDTMARISADLARLDAAWLRGRQRSTSSRLMPGSVECVDEGDYGRGREIAYRIEAGERVLGNCLTVRIGND
jgi:hypothetical protein